MIIFGSSHSGFNLAVIVNAILMQAEEKSKK